MPEQVSRNPLVSPARPQREPLDEAGVRLWAPAKINLNLLAGPAGSDGFHPLDSLVAKVTLYDRIDLQPRDDGRIIFSCNGADCGPDEQNLALRAAKLLVAHTDSPIPGVEVALKKHIPPGAGLGGGSSDAAAVLAGLNEMWNLQLAESELGRLAIRLGSDVPLFLGPPAARMTGRGELLSPVDLHPFLAVLYLPAFACNTAEVYRAFNRKAGERLRQLKLDVLVAEPPSQWRSMLVNQLAAPAMDVCAGLREEMQRLSAAGQLPVCLSGSGSAMFILCDDNAELAAIWGRLDEEMKRRCAIVRANPW
ncbi:MAG: 4-(cytidine 5'-diphospho)-2-C-methyl-D-erythritol kinase [Planctomycetota bacterium]|nr:4-(cytidine 5'-diphospho)-2-C-methyl-D-erythritol kinase [Planctomycetota bacterium]